MTQIALADTNIKDHLAIDSDDTTLDTLLQEYIDAAVDLAQDYCMRKFLNDTVIEKFDQFPAVIRPRYAALVSVTSIQYVDSNGETQTLDASNYQVATDSEPGRILPAWNCSWPSTRDQAEAVTITYVAGYGASVSDIPSKVLHAIYQTVAVFLNNRECGPMPKSAMHMLSHERVRILS